MTGQAVPTKAGRPPSRRYYESLLRVSEEAYYELDLKPWTKEWHWWESPEFRKLVTRAYYDGQFHKDDPNMDAWCQSQATTYVRREKQRFDKEIKERSQREKQLAERRKSPIHVHSEKPPPSPPVKDPLLIEPTYEVEMNHEKLQTTADPEPSKETSFKPVKETIIIGSKSESKDKKAKIALTPEPDFLKKAKAMSPYLMKEAIYDEDEEIRLMDMWKKTQIKKMAELKAKAEKIANDDTDMEEEPDEKEEEIPE